MSPVKKYDPEQIEKLTSSLGDANKEIARILETLDNFVVNLRSQWSGEASDAYDAAHARWTTQLAEMNRILDKANNASANSARRYARARAKIAARWS